MMLQTWSWTIIEHDYRHEEPVIPGALPEAEGRIIQPDMSSLKSDVSSLQDSVMIFIDPRKKSKNGQRTPRTPRTLKNGQQSKVTLMPQPVQALKGILDAQNGLRKHQNQPFAQASLLIIVSLEKSPWVSSAHIRQSSESHTGRRRKWIRHLDALGHSCMLHEEIRKPLTDWACWTHTSQDQPNLLHEGSLSQETSTAGSTMRQRTKLRLRPCGPCTPRSGSAPSPSSRSPPRPWRHLWRVRVFNQDLQSFIVNSCYSFTFKVKQAYQFIVN